MTAPPADALAANLDVLAQARRLIDALGSERYARQPARPGRSSVGAHLRHVLEHYDAFLLGLPLGVVDYTARPRDAELERSAATARRHAARLAARLAELDRPALEGPLRVTDDAGPAASTGARELGVLLAHAVHHFALIRLLAEEMDVELPAGLGVARSTLEHRAATCASA